ncbi:pyruvate, phosphate dikinase, partial [Streptomyces sp. NPDC127091]|uniref:pyruvate, phosphate dikinase n=1 Tax=Streptomyces sp. NPDC127091 TaxID=3347134 RepID=UPI003667F79D
MTTTIADPVIFLDGSQRPGKELLGGKAFSLNEMSSRELPVPPAFALPTSMCGVFHDAGGVLPDSVWEQVVAHVARLEVLTGRTFGSGPAPLLVSVRSGAAQSMPGMMDTVLNLGLTPSLVEALATDSGDARWAQDTWERFRKSYAKTVAGDPAAEPPTDPYEQLRAAIGAVFGSWNNERVAAYRERHHLGVGGGTAVTVQAMVFGNRGTTSGTGVLFSRNPSTGEPGLYGEWLACAQGEDVVSGECTPDPIATLHDQQPRVYDDLKRIAAEMEGDLRDLADIEFTVEQGRLYVLQCRAGKRTPRAAVRIALDLFDEGVLSAEEVSSRVSVEQVEQVLSERSVADGHEVLARGQAVGSGTAYGLAVTDTDEAVARAAEGESVVLVRVATDPADVPAMFSSVAVVTEIGGSTSHAALVCREIGLPCVVGAGEGTVGALVGRRVTVDGASGLVLAGDAHEQVAGDGVARYDLHLERLAEVVTEGPVAELLRRAGRARRPGPRGGARCAARRRRPPHAR